jgi:hypothetical protein
MKTICTWCKWHLCEPAVPRAVHYCYNPKLITRKEDFVTGVVTTYPVLCSEANTKGKCRKYQELVNMVRE